MATMTNLEIPTGARCFIDANLLLYHFIDVPVLSELVKPLLCRIVAGEIAGCTSAIVLSEALHAIMLAEVRSTFAIAKTLAHVQRHPELISNLVAYPAAARAIEELGLELLPMDIAIFAQAASFAQTHDLLTNDATTLALMTRHGIERIATNDSDFNEIPSLIVHQPR